MHKSAFFEEKCSLYFQSKFFHFHFRETCVCWIILLKKTYKYAFLFVNDKKTSGIYLQVDFEVRVNLIRILQMDTSRQARYDVIGAQRKPSSTRWKNNTLETTLQKNKPRSFSTASICDQFHICTQFQNRGTHWYWTNVTQESDGGNLLFSLTYFKF